MDYIDTPESRFEDLVDYPFAPNFVAVDDNGMKMHYLDEGPKTGPVVLMLHGEPSWSYLYRFMIPKVAAAGIRVIAPDLIGFGKSSKPTSISDHSYAQQCAWVRTCIETLDLRDITLFGQDWGSLIGLRLAAQMPEQFGRILIANGFLPTGAPQKLKMSGVVGLATFLTWKTFARFSPWFVMSKIVNLGSKRSLTDEELRAYDAPFPDKRYMAGARALPGLVPLSPANPAHGENLRAWEALGEWTKPFETAFSTGDPIMRGLDRALQKHIPGAEGRDHTRVSGGHFVQEDSPDELSARIVDLVQSDSKASQPISG